MNNSLISVIVPAFNEEKYLNRTINALIEWGKAGEIIIIDDGSIDRTKEIISEIAARHQSVRKLFLLQNQGKGQALAAGVKEARGDILLFIDADLGETARYAENLLSPIINGQCDMAVAVLPKGKKKAGFGLVKRLARTGIYYLTGFDSVAPLSGQRAIKRVVFDKVTSFRKGFGIEVGLTIDALKSGFTIVEVEVPFKHRETGRDVSGFLHRGKEFIAVLSALFVSIRRSRL